MADSLEKLEQQADLLFNKAEGWNTNALRRIGRRIKEIGSLSHADLKALNNAAIVKQDVNAIIAELAKLTEQSAADVLNAYLKMLKEQHLKNQPLYDYRKKPFVPFDENRELKAIAKAYAKTTLGTMVNLSRTRARAIGTVSKNGVFTPLEKSFKEVLDRAVLAVSTGTGDFNSEMRDAIRTLGGSGMRIDYGGGVTRRVDSMVRQNLLWGAKRASKEYNEMIGEELGCDGIEIDWHSNPRPSHGFMQGRQFSLHGRKVINGVVYEDAQEALSALEDYGCLHFETPIILGVSEPGYSPEKLAELNRENTREIEIDGIKKTGYGWKQTMRHLEREARITKEQIELFNASGDVTEAKNLRYKLTAIGKRYNKVAEYSGITAQLGRTAYTKGVSRYVDNSAKRGIMKERNFASRNLAMSLRKPSSDMLSENEIASLLDDIRAIGADEKIFRFNSGYQTSYVDEFDIINIRGDVMPDKYSKSPRDMMSARAVIAHEYYGHRAYRGTKLPKGSWNDEFRASYMAAKNTPNLTDEDRRYLVLDALERAKEKGITIGSNDFIRRTLYGY